MKNRYLQSAFLGHVEFWRYLVMIVVVFCATQFGSIPITVVILAKSVREKIFLTMDNLYDFEQLGISLNLALFLMLLSFVFGLAAFILLFKPLHGKSILTILTGRKKFDFGRLFFSMLVWTLFIFISMIIYNKIYPGRIHFQFDAGKFIILAVISLLFISMQSMFEELIFRGYLVQGLSVLFKNVWMPLLITSIVFGGLHILNPEIREFGICKGLTIVFPQYIIFGLLLCIMVIMDEGLELAIGVHAANNIVLSLFFTYESSALQTDALFELTYLDPEYSLIENITFCVLFLIIMSFRYKWGSFRKLFLPLYSDRV